MVIGVDFDNTLVSYDDLLERLARERGFISGEDTRGKKSIRDRIRQFPNGDIEWQKLQGIMYGSRLNEARIMDGVPEFLNVCRQRRVSVSIVSHKTEYAGYDDTHTSLRHAALTWMERQQFFSPTGFGLRREDVFFAGTRAEKLATIQRLGCTWFIDDLEETFLEPTFPPGPQKILFAPHGGHGPPAGVRVCHTWREILECVFDGAI